MLTIYDCGHHYRYCPNDDILARYGSRLVALHLHDYSESRVPRRLPFDGTIDWPKAMGLLAQVGYSGSTAIEVMNWSYEHIPVDDFLAAAFERGQRLQALLEGAIAPKA